MNLSHLPSPNNCFCLLPSAFCLFPSVFRCFSLWNMQNRFFVDVSNNSYRM